MALTDEEIKELKTQLKSQIQHLPPEKKAEAESQIDSMSPESIETMLNEQRTQSQAPKVFRMIIEKKIPSVVIEENQDAIAVLSTKSISRGHTLIIPKNPVQSEKEFSKETHNLSQEISKKILSSLKAKSTSIIPEKNFGEIVLNIIPIYNSPLDLSSPKTDVQIEDLEKIKIEINVVKIEKDAVKEKIKIKKPKKPEIIRLSRKVP